MCTTTIYIGKDRRVLTMNRDEARLRGPEVEPQTITAEDEETRLLMPIDGASGGTWIGVNSHGIAAFLMNYYGLDAEQGGPIEFDRSRGEIVPKVLRGNSLDEAEEILRRDFDPKDYPPFLLGVLGANEVGSWTWKGWGNLERVSDRESWIFFTSSSVEPEAVSNWRSEAFEDWLASGWKTPEEVLDFHFYQDARNASWSPMMSRDPSCTRSVTQIAIDGRRKEARLRYWGRPTPNETESRPTSENNLELDGRKKALVAGH